MGNKGGNLSGTASRPSWLRMKHNPKNRSFRKRPPTLEKQNTTDNIRAIKEKGELKDFYDVSKNVLGRGHYAVVVPAKNKRTGARVAVKRIKISGSRKEALKREVEVLERIGAHPNIVTLHDIFITDTEVQLVLELLEGGELFDRLAEQGPYSEQQASHHIRKIGLALQFLHERGIVHRDLKPENLILTSNADDAELKIADFGLSKIVDDAASSTMKTVCGTWAYCAPEVKTSRVSGSTSAAYTAKVDMWSCGVIMFVILGAYHPFDVNGDADDAELWRSICKGVFDFEDPAWEGISTGARDLLRKLIVLDPEKRYSTAQLLNHPWILQSGPAQDDHVNVPHMAPITPRINQSLGNYNKRAKRRFTGLATTMAAVQKFKSHSMDARPNMTSAPGASIDIPKTAGGSARAMDTGGGSEDGERARVRIASSAPTVVFFGRDPPAAPPFKTGPRRTVRTEGITTTEGVIRAPDVATPMDLERTWPPIIS